ncbi:sulfurtransferase complex subunit TusB [Enterobacteriaceae endosymbiont of Macroplea appendiculata]|uniref:sulfurtransferase complex subunit TusB n=1 Tax=Enterobacteriaceae endosymbiont of Macroplea appendiculata TaxID=2675790 RepID=UPI00144962FF|nr:sulfurtransferase complex subunit TusB [Enterobacteriaceae endosymbiont of Macroplea appendiculata]QJC30932.1 sulfurtransferase complex subunit TusB [Enterobacteriaceae endosymbiont of Macroplea appendiculata]
MLYILSNSPLCCNFVLLLDILNKNDDLILIQDGVLAGLSNSIFYKKIRHMKYQKQLSIFAIQNDIVTRGLLNNFSKEIIIIDYKQFVDLTVKHKQQILWS